MLDFAIFAHWKQWYDHSAATSATVTFAHVSGLMLGGGSAVAADLGTLRAARGSSRSRIGHVAELARIHRFVLIGLGLTIASGALMVAADLDTFLGSWVFWLKMSLIAVLLGNGVVLTRTESRLRNALLPEARGWSRLETTARVSLVLWFGLLFLGTLLRSA